MLVPKVHSATIRSTASNPHLLTLGDGIKSGHVLATHNPGTGAAAIKHVSNPKHLRRLTHNEELDTCNFQGKPIYNILDFTVGNLSHSIFWESYGINTFCVWRNDHDPVTARSLQ